MATILKVKRLSNPRGGTRKATKARTRARRKMTPLQRMYFGPKRTRKAARTRRAKRRSNPALVATLGALNPRKRSHSMARRRRTTRRAGRVTTRRRRRVASNPRRTRRNYKRRRRNSVVVVTRRRRRSNPVRRSRSRVSRRRVSQRRVSRRNPTLFGNSITSRKGLTLIGGGIAGVVAAKFIPTMLPVSLVGSLGGTSIGRTLITGVSAVLAGWAAGKVDREFGEGVMFGGLMQTASVAFNAFLPGIYSQLGVGLGDLMPGGFPVPQNPIRAGIPAPPPANARVTMNGLARAYGAAY